MPGEAAAASPALNSRALATLGPGAALLLLLRAPPAPPPRFRTAAAADPPAGDAAADTALAAADATAGFTAAEPATLRLLPVDATLPPGAALALLVLAADNPVPIPPNSVLPTSS